jgi:acyl carrier protein
VPPQTETERAIANAWKTVLNLEMIGTHDNFFELGGHSLLATRVMSKIREEFQTELPLRQFFLTPTIAGLSEAVDTMLWATQTQSTDPGKRTHWKYDNI